MIVANARSKSVSSGNQSSSASLNIPNSAKAADTVSNVKKNASTNTIFIPAEYKSALNQAKRYNYDEHMSKAGLYDQFVSEYGEQFTAEEAQYAIDNLS